MVVQSAIRPSIIFFYNEIQHSHIDNPKHPSLYYFSYVDSHPSKRVLVDNGSAINFISSMELEILKVSIKFLNAPTLIIRAFNNTLARKMGTVILSMKVGVREIPAICHVVEGEMQYRFLLGHSWIEDMDIVMLTLHRCLRFLYNE